MQHPIRVTLAAALALCIVNAAARAAVLEVGPGKKYAHPNAALADAQAGDTIRVWPNVVDGKPAPYERVALYVDKPWITIECVGHEVVFSGRDFEYSGRGRVPRAIVQFNPGADGGAILNATLTGATNATHNGAGVRINQANRVRIFNCQIHGNDMGVMSNGDGTGETGRDQVINRCWIYENGNKEDPGFNHNLYLGGASVRIQGCFIHHAITGHNVKSRAHLTTIIDCHIYHSANRELDLVDAKETALPGSHAFVLFSTIVKDPDCAGNKGVIHFGAENGEHNGTFHLINSVVVTPFVSPAVELSDKGAGAKLINAVIYNPGQQRNQVLASVRRGASLDNLSAMGNWLSKSFAQELPDGIKGRVGHIADADNPFIHPEGLDYRVKPGLEPFETGGVAIEVDELPGSVGRSIHEAWRLKLDGRRPMIGLPIR